MNKIEPCPFCKGKGRLNNDYAAFHDGGYQVECYDNEDCLVSGSIRKTKEEAIEAWNEGSEK